MDFTFDIKALAPCRKQIGVTIPGEQVRAEYDRQYGELNRQLAMPGFRKGHAPRKMLEKRFGTAMVGEVKESLVRAALEQLVRNHKVEPMAPPSIDLHALALDPARDLRFEFELATRPEFETPSWQGLPLELPAVNVAEEDVDKAVDSVRRRAARLEPAPDAAIAEGDVLVIDWKASEGEAVLAEDKGVWHPYGRGAVAGFVAPEVEQALLGKKAPAEARGQVTADADDPREGLRGKALSLEVQVHEVRRPVLPEVDEAFLKKMDYDDVAEMRADLKRQLTRAKVRERDEAAEDGLVDTVVGSARIDLPADLLDQELESWAARRRMELEQEGTTDAARLDAQVAEGRAGARERIAAELKRFFVLDRIARDAGLAVGDQEVAQALSEIAQAYGRPVEEVLAAYRQGGRIEELRTQLRHRKVREEIRRTAKVSEKA